jgi:predicted nucleic acid-binding protein
VDFELSRERTPVAVREWLSERPEWLEIQAPQPHRRQEIPATLGQGKREAIALAEEVRADALLIDDLDARREASRRGLPVVGTLRVPADAGASDLLDLAEAVARLQATNFRVDPELLRPVIGGLPPSQER